jgi:hypothetical protein
VADKLGVKVQDVPPATFGGSNQSVTEPEFARKMLFTVFLGILQVDAATLGISLTNVNLLDMRHHKQRAKFEKFYMAWTNSATDVYINYEMYEQVAKKFPVTGVTNSVRNTQLWFVLALRHELHHVTQFNTSGRPRSYKAMCDFEKGAYAQDVQWLDANRTLLKNAGMEDAIFTAIRSGNDKAARDMDRISRLGTESAIKAAMVRDSNLPPHANIDELYEDQ